MPQPTHDLAAAAGPQPTGHPSILPPSSHSLSVSRAYYYYFGLGRPGPERALHERGSEAYSCCPGAPTVLAPFTKRPSSTTRTSNKK